MQAGGTNYFFFFVVARRPSQRRRQIEIKLKKKKREGGFKKNYKNSVKIASVFCLVSRCCHSLDPFHDYFPPTDLLIVAAVRFFVDSAVLGQQVRELVAILKHLPIK